MENYCFTTSSCDFKNLGIKTFSYLKLMKKNIASNHTIIRLDNKRKDTIKIQT